MNSATILTSRHKKKITLTSEKRLWTFCLEGQLGKETRERSTGNVMSEPAPGVGSRITARS